ncbi:glycosyl hydrolase family 95 catalytic domain-containing protein [Paenibacillus whitsoniae]|uniref:Sugar phosphorylase n=1 Tax=Paenibacillus whitsoniae TaxID=2496558 RepID=A0A3S0CDN9_9BACL|nr:glycoside hydrolase N-terminal domain-containing protein [Paenibacillus whitsoniae]RTE11583.1 sugar phosphorylase [Paenibacillus whitsoniae]
MRGVTYENAPSGWNEALPLGNGHFGGMVFYEDNRLTMAMNHYDVYYRKLNRYSRAFREGEGRDFERQYGYSFEELRQRALEMYRNPQQEAIFLYGDALSPESMYRKYGKASGGTSHYPTGELRLFVNEGLREAARSSLSLDVERAEVRLGVEVGEKDGEEEPRQDGERLEASFFVAQGEDWLVTEIRQSSPGLLPAVELAVPARRYVNMQVTYHQEDETTFYYRGSFYPDGEDRERHAPFSFVVVMKIVGAVGRLLDSEDGDGLHIELCEAGREVTLLTTVVTEEETGDPLRLALARAAGVDLARVAMLREAHRQHWTQFWRRSSVSLSDPVLEDLWYINLYAIACSSGRGGRMIEQACGLNGLWDIKQPTKWGSMWYWDVNIQAAFWPLYTANHLEVAQAFNDGLLSYVAEAERMAEQFYGMEGIAGDYPHALYFSIWPWCAQFLWNYYRYSGDLGFLREQAYPLFRKTARFFESFLQENPETGRLDIFPDISPEQGPLTRNSTCSLSAVKYLLLIASEAGELVGAAESDAFKWRALAERLAPYPTGESPGYGGVFLDSEWAPATVHLRHPSLLMPIYPIGEVDRYSETDVRRRAENTLRYAAKNTEYGMFQFGWLSCVASRLGLGDTALRLLYEQGIDLSLRVNGLFAEETERWMNYCNITNEPLYHPFMMEASGELVAAVNEMLLQSYSGVIEVFPAVPDGLSEMERPAGEYAHLVYGNVRSYVAWEECAYRGLLAVGAFEVSARRVGGRTMWVYVVSQAGNRAVLRHPWAVGTRVQIWGRNGTGWSTVQATAEGDCLAWDTQAGWAYAIYPQEVELLPEEIEGWCLASSFSKRPDPPSAGSATPRVVRPLVHQAHTGRRVFLGKDGETDLLRKLDHFTFDYYAGNHRESRLAAYRLDFGVGAETQQKRYELALPRQMHVGGVLGQTFRPISPDMLFTARAGIGWEPGSAALVALDRGEPDELRRDFIGGETEATFVIELPRGRYDVLFITGDSEAPSYTEIAVEGQSTWKPERALQAGEFACDILPIAMRKDGYAGIRFSTLPGMVWRINVLIVNKGYVYL